MMRKNQYPFGLIILIIVIGLMPGFACQGCRDGGKDKEHSHEHNNVPDKDHDKEHEKDHNNVPDKAPENVPDMDHDMEHGHDHNNVPDKAPENVPDMDHDMEHGHDHNNVPDMDHEKEHEKAPDPVKTNSSTPKTIASEVKLTDIEVAELGIRTQRVRASRLSTTVQGAGELRSVPGAEAPLKVSGRGVFLATDTQKRPGQVVSRGELLGHVAVWTSEAQAELVQSEWNTSWTVWQGEKKRLERAKKLQEKGLESRERVEELETLAELARSRVNTAWARSARLKKANTGRPDPTTMREIRAPIDGTLVRSSAADGLAVEDGQELFLIRDDRTLVLRVRVFDTDIPRLGAHPDGWFILGGSTGPATPHPLSSAGSEPAVVMPDVDAVTRTGTVLVRLDNRAGKLRSGQWARVFFRTAEADEGPTVPREAIIREGFLKIAYVRTKPGTYARRRVRTGTEDENSIRVLEGIAAGEEVVVANPQKLLYLSAAAVIPQSAHTH